MVFEHEWFLNTNIFLNTNNSRISRILIATQYFQSKTIRVIRVIRVQKTIFFVFKKQYSSCSKIIFFVFKKKLLFVFENSKLLRRAEARGTALKLHLLFRSLALVRNSVERGHDIGIFCLAVVVGQLVEGL